MGRVTGWAIYKQNMDVFILQIWVKAKLFPHPRYVKRLANKVQFSFKFSKSRPIFAATDVNRLSNAS